MHGEVTENGFLEKRVCLSRRMKHRSHGTRGHQGGQVFVRLAVAVGFREGSEGEQRTEEVSFTFFTRFKDEGLHEGRQKKIKKQAW